MFEKKDRTEADRVLRKYPDRIPILITKQRYSSVKDIDQRKYLVPIELTLGQFQYVIRKRLQLSPDKALFFFINGDIYCPTTILNCIYEKEHDTRDGLLHITYSEEGTFG